MKIRAERIVPYPLFISHEGWLVIGQSLFTLSTILSDDILEKRRYNQKQYSK